MSAMLAPTPREAWLAQRRTGLGASDVAAVFGLNPWKSQVDLWMEKTGRDTPVDLAATQRNIRFGQFGEEFVAREYSLATGRRVQRFTTMLRHEGSPLLANLDRLVIPEGQKIAAHQGKIRTNLGLECKTANTFAALDSEEWGRAGSDHVPVHYLLQAHTYITLTPCDEWDLAVLFGNGAREDDFRIFHFRRDRELSKEIVARATEWWQRHIVADVAPEPVNDGDLKRLYPKSTKDVQVIANPEAVADVERLRTVRARFDLLKDEREQLEVRIKAAIGHADTLVDDSGNVLATWKSAKDSQVTDWPALAKLLVPTAELVPIVQQYTTPKAGSRRFLLKDLK